MSGATYHYPQKMGRIILLSMEEVIGKAGVNAILDLTALDSNLPAKQGLSFEAVKQLHLALEQAYGPRGGRGVALRTGRACFKYGLKEYGSMLGLTEMTFRLLPLSTKLHTGARSLADLFNKHTDQKVRVEETEAHIFWHIERCPLCWERTEEEPICHLAIGLLQEALYWLSGGKVFRVEETACHARGDDHCTISILKTPLT
ncbi:MAG: 4-vinyl reductase [Anaerolineales bacterium]